jgi:hypothetical protein
MQEESHIITHHQDAGLLTVDDDLPELPSALPFEQVKEVKEDVDAATLSPGERAQIARDLLAYRIRRDLSAPRNPYALAVV